MSNYYNLDGIKTELNKRIENTKALLEAWQRVKFPTKKDGKPFAIMSKNFLNAKYTETRCAMQSGEYELTVYTSTNLNGYISDYIKCYELVRYLKDDVMIAKTQNYQPKHSYLEQIYTFDIDDIKNAINKRIEYLTEYLHELYKQYEESEKVYNTFKEAYSNAMETLKECTKDFNHNDLYYMVKDTIKDKYPYC